jgi:hypothetical protein
MIEYIVKVSNDGDKAWYLNGKRHREDGPALEHANGDKYWYLNGEHHREDGPALECAGGDKYWYLNGEYLTKDEWRAKLQPQPSCDGKVVEIDGKKYKLTEIQ